MKTTGTGHVPNSRSCREFLLCSSENLPKLLKGRTTGKAGNEIIYKENAKWWRQCNALGKIPWVLEFMCTIPTYALLQSKCTSFMARAFPNASVFF